MAPKTVYSNKGDVTKAQILYCTGSLGMYLKGQASVIMSWKGCVTKMMAVLNTRNMWTRFTQPILQSIGFGIQGVFDAVSLVFVQFTVGVGRLAFFLKGHNHEAHEDVDHEEGDDDYVNDVENCHTRTVVNYGTHALLIRIDADVQNPGKKVMIYRTNYYVSRKNPDCSYPGQPSKVETTKRLSIPLGTLS